MPPGATTSALSLVLLLLASGCADTKAATPDAVQVSGIDFGAGTATIVGTVVDAELAPVVYASVTIDDFAPLITDETGGFTASGLPQGMHAIRVTGDQVGEALVEVELASGEIRSIQIAVDRTASQEPYVEVLTMRGYSICDRCTWNLCSPGDDVCPAGAGGEKKNNIFTWNVSESWRFLVAEIAWTSGYSGIGDSFRLSTGPHRITCSASDPCFGAVYGEGGYLKMEGEPGKTEVDLWYDPWSDGSWLAYPNGTYDITLQAIWAGFLREQAGPQCKYVTPITNGGAVKKGGCYGIGFSYGLPFEVWLSVFHWDKPDQPNTCCPTTDYTATNRG